MGYRYGIWYVDMVMCHINMVILDIDMGYGLILWEMTASIRSSSISKMISGHCYHGAGGGHADVAAGAAEQGRPLHFSAQRKHFLWDRGSHVGSVQGVFRVC